MEPKHDVQQVSFHTLAGLFNFLYLFVLGNESISGLLICCLFYCFTLVSFERFFVYPLQPSSRQHDTICCCLFFSSELTKFFGHQNFGVVFLHWKACSIESIFVTIGLELFVSMTVLKNER